MALNFTYRMENMLLIIDYDEEEFRKVISNVHPQMDVGQLKELADRPYNTDALNFIKYKCKFNEKVLQHIVEARNRLLKRFIKSYYSSWMVLDYNQ